MKILIVNTLYSPFKVGGAEVSVQILAEELVMKGHSVRVVTLHNEKKGKCLTLMVLVFAIYLLKIFIGRSILVLGRQILFKKYCGM